MLDQIGKLREVLGDRRDHPVGTILLDLVPRSLAEAIGLRVHVDRDDVLAGRRERRVVHGGEAQFDVGGVGRDALHGLRLLGVHVGDERVQLHDPGVVGLHAAPGQSLHIRQLAKRQVHLDAGAHASVRLDPREERPGQVGGIAQLQERALRVRVREHAACADLVAVRELHADGATAGRDHAGDIRLAPDRAARLPCGVRHDRGEPTHPTPHEAPLPDAPLGLLAGVVVQQDVGGAGRGGTGDAVVDRVPAERGLHVLALEPFRQELRRARGEQEREIGQLPPVPNADPSPARELAQVRERAHARIGRRPVERGDHPLDHRRQMALERRQGACVRGREASRLGHVRGHVLAEVVVRAVGEQVERRTGRIDHDAAPHEVHVLPDGLAQHRQDVGARGRAEPRSELFRVAGAPDERAALEDQRRETRAREIEAGDEPVVAAADDDRVVGLRCHGVERRRLLPISLGPSNARTLAPAMVDCQPSAARNTATFATSSGSLAIISPSEPSTISSLFGMMSARIRPSSTGCSSSPS